MNVPQTPELSVSRLGRGEVVSPLENRGERFVEDGKRILAASEIADLEGYLRRHELPPSFEAAGPRSKLFHDPKTLVCGVVTCGGLCPGLNNVIRSIVLTMVHGYGAPQVLGFRYGFNGLSADPAKQPMILTPEVVKDIHRQGGTLLGSSRGPQDVGEMVDVLVQREVGLLFTIGGDGTLQGAAALSGEIARRGLSIGVIGIPKTIDNDIGWVERSFGFTTAVEAAQGAVAAAHAEARGAWNGIGLVQLMGRHSGFIAAHATLASGDVNFCLVPEVPFLLEGPNGFLHALERRLEDRRHAVIVVAEGAGQEMLAGSLARDPSGNVRLKAIGRFLQQRIEDHFAARSMDITLKYIDPSYMIRSRPAGALDSAFCLLLGQHAVHAGMAGRTNMAVSYWNQHFIHLPIPLAVARRKQLDPQGELWQRVVGATGQPPTLDDKTSVLRGLEGGEP